MQAVEEWRLEEPTWGKAKIVVKLREQGFTASEATVGRILAHLVQRGAIQSVPAMRKAAKTRKWTAKRRFAERLPKCAKATKPGQIVQLDTVYVTLAPAATSSTSPPTIRSPNGPSPRPSSAPRQPRPQSSSTSS